MASLSRRILTINAGSSSIKFALFEPEGLRRIVSGAIERIGQVDSWPVVTESQLPGDGPWQISARAGVRRGRLPDALQTLMFWSDAWHRSSNWYSWTLVH